MKKLLILSLFALLLMAGCSTAQVEPTPTIDVEALARADAATALAHFTETSIADLPTPSGTPTPSPFPTVTPTDAPIPEPIAAVAAANVTVRSEPRKGGKNLGGIFFNRGMKVIARNDVSNWYYIEWDKSPTGAAWVTAPAVKLTEDELTHLPIAIINDSGRVVVLPPLIWEITGTPLPLNSPSAGARTGTLKQLAKVRVGPGIGYSTMGTLPDGNTVVVTGRTEDNAWLQIEYPSGPGGHGWVAGELIDMQSPFAGLPYYNLLATPVGDPGVAATADPNATPEPTITPQPTLAGPPGEITGSEVNVRSGPASSYKILGTLKRGDPVVITGETINHLWYQIVYADGPGGRAWVAIGFIKVTGGDLRKLPFFDNLGTPLP